MQEEMNVRCILFVTYYWNFLTVHLDFSKRPFWHRCTQVVIIYFGWFIKWCVLYQVSWLLNWDSGTFRLLCVVFVWIGYTCNILLSTGYLHTYKPSLIHSIRAYKPPKQSKSKEIINLINSINFALYHQLPLTVLTATVDENTYSYCYW